MKNKQLTLMLVTLSFVLFMGFSTQVLAGETYKMGMSLAITRARQDCGFSVRLDRLSVLWYTCCMFLKLGQAATLVCSGP